MTAERESPYRTESREGQWLVVFGDDTVIFSTRDARSAGHYASLLNAAHRRGYKAGYKDARAGRAPP